MDPNQKLSDHFTLYEMMRSETAQRLGIDNTPPDIFIPKLTFFCENILEPIRNHFGVPYRPNSVYRCMELNTALKSKKTSQHPKAEAGDLEVPGTSNFDLAVWIRDNLVFDKLILECYTPGIPTSGWVHVSVIEKNRGEILTYSKGKFINGLIK